MKKNEPLYMEGVGYFIPAIEGYAVGHDGFSKAILSMIEKKRGDRKNLISKISKVLF